MILIQLNFSLSKNFSIGLLSPLQIARLWSSTILKIFPDKTGNLKQNMSSVDFEFSLGVLDAIILVKILPIFEDSQDFFGFEFYRLVFFMCVFKMF